MTRDEWKNYKDFDELRREMSGGFAANNLFGAGMTHLSASSFLKQRDLKRPQSSAQSAAYGDMQSETPHAE